MSDEKIIVGCIIMASGQGKRFGSNKLMADFCGEPLLAASLKVTENLFSQRFVVTKHKLVADYCEKNKIDFVEHTFPNRNDTIRIGLTYLEHIEPNVTHCLFAMGDQPLIQKATLENLLAAVQKEPEYIWRLASETTVGAPVVFPKRFFSELKTLPIGKGGGVLLKKYANQVHTVPVLSDEELLDVDTLEDLRKITEIKHSL